MSLTSENSTSNPYGYVPSYSFQLDFFTSLAAEAFDFFHGQFTDKYDTITAVVDKNGGIDIAGTGIYSLVGGTVLCGTHFNPHDTITVTFTEGCGGVGIKLGITDPSNCFAAGTLIETENGPRAVETLVVGDRLWAFGRVAPVTWVGNRTIDMSTVADKSLVLPIRLRAGALSAGLPERDLVVSPDHAFWLDGKLIPARLLVNGVSIVQESCTEITYYHVALDRHDLILAEGVQAESYLDVAAIDAERTLAIEVPAALAAYASHGFAPLCIDAASVKPVWDALSARAGTAVAANDLIPSGAAPFALLVDGQLVHPTQIGHESGVTRFGCDLPLGARLVTVVSAAASPWSVSPWMDDRRQLGVAVSSIAADGVALSLDDSAMVCGWHGLETAAHAYRWTDGAASLVLPVAAGRLEIGIVAVAETRRIANAA